MLRAMRDAYVPSSLLLEELTSPEVGQALAAGFTSVVVACGAVEQHGPHIAMVSDALHAGAAARGLAAEMGHTLVAPTIAVGCSDHHLAFPGTISIRAETLEALYTDYCRSLAHHGFKRILCISGHGGNFAPLSSMLPRLRQAVAPVEVAAFTDLEGLVGIWREAVRASGADPAGVGGHADIAEGSVVMSLRPDLVHTELADVGFMGGMEAALAVTFRDGLHTITPNGILGDGRGLTPAIGERCLHETAKQYAAYFRSPAAWS
jgi:creatinine amidohydrolase